MMKMILMDDEPLAMTYLENQLKSIADVEIAGKFTNPLEGLDYLLEADDIDIVFMDIHMPEMCGIEIADRLLGMKPQAHIVFVTGHDDYAIQAFEMNALDYVLKPAATDRLKKTLQRIQESRNAQASRGLTENSLYLKLFHQVSLDAGDNQVTQIRWRTTRVQELFLYLLQHRGELVRKSVLADLLWPGYEPNRAYAQLYTAVYHIRKKLEPFGDHFTLSNATEGYILSIHNVRLDVEEWEKNVMSGMAVNAETIGTFEHFMGLYTGDYLKEFDYWWSESERHRLKVVWLRVSMQMSEWYVACGQQKKAVERYLDICDHHPQVEEAHFALMKLFALMNRHLSVHRQYRLLVAVLSEELNEQPSPYITEWYNDWSSNNKG